MQFEQEQQEVVTPYAIPGAVDHWQRKPIRAKIINFFTSTLRPVKKNVERLVDFSTRNHSYIKPGAGASFATVQRQRLRPFVPD